MIRYGSAGLKEQEAFDEYLEKSGDRKIFEKHLKAKQERKELERRIPNDGKPNDEIERVYEQGKFTFQ